MNGGSVTTDNSKLSQNDEDTQPAWGRMMMLNADYDEVNRWLSLGPSSRRGYRKTGITFHK